MKQIVIHLPLGPDVDSNPWINAITRGDDEEVWRLARQDANGDADTAALLRGEYWKLLFELLTRYARDRRYGILAPLYAEAFVAEVEIALGCKIKYRYLGHDGTSVQIEAHTAEAVLISTAQQIEASDRNLARNAVSKMTERGAFREATWAAADRLKFEYLAKAVRSRLVTTKSGMN